MNETTPDVPDGVQAEEDAPPVALVPWGAEDWALVVQAGSDSADLYRALAHMPAGLEFVEAHGDVDVILVYRAPNEAVPSRRGCAGAALRAVLTRAGEDGARWMTAGERDAYRTGKADALDAIRWNLADAVGAGHRPSGRV